MLGIFHAVHCPVLIVYPYITDHYDTAYLLYFFMMVSSYFALNHECMISYYAKKQVDPLYIAGSNLTWYPEMHLFTTNDRHIKVYFTTTTAIYAYSLYMVLRRFKINVKGFKLYFFGYRNGSSETKHQGLGQIRRGNV